MKEKPSGVSMPVPTQLEDISVYGGTVCTSSVGIPCRLHPLAVVCEERDSY